MIYCAAVVLLAGFVRGYSGFGFSAIIVAGLGFVTSPLVAVPLAVLLEITASIFQARSIFAHVDWKRMGVLMIGAIVGNPLGVAILEHMPADTLKTGVYVFILASAIVLLFSRSQGIRLGSFGWLLVGIAAGAINGATALSGLFIVVVMTLSVTPPSAMRATLVGYFFASDLYVAGIMVWRELIDVNLVTLALVSLPLVGLGIHLGSRRFLSSTDLQFRQATLILLVMLGLTGLGTALLT